MVLQLRNLFWQICEKSKILFWQKDIEKAVNLFGESSILGNVEATFFYAVALLCGFGIEADLKKAAIYFKKAADFENIPSSYIYATMSECGIGISQKDIEAASFYYEGAIKDNVESILKYAIFCYEGKGIKKDKKEALKWFKKAADLGNQTAKAFCLYNVITGEEEGNIEDSINELNEIANNGDFYASYLIGCCYEKGYYYKADEKKSIEIFDKASNNGNIDSTIKVIEYDEKGIINKDAKYYEEKKNPLSQLYYGKKCLKSTDKQIKKEGLDIIKKLSDDNYLNPMIEYGRIQLRKKFNEGYELLKKSSELIPKVDCSDYFHLENIEFKTNMIVNMHMDYNYPDTNLSTIYDWIPVIADTITNASEFNIDEIDFISGKGNHCSDFCMSQILVLLVTKRLGYVSYIDPTNQGIIICQVKLGKIEFKKENNDNEIRNICPEMPDECIDIIMTNIPQSEIQKFVTDFENRLQIQKYIDLNELNENRELRINQQYEGLKNFNLDEQFKEDIIKKVIKGNADKIVDILNRIQKEITIDFLSFFHEILMKYDIPTNSLLDIMKKEKYNKDNILQRLKEQPTIGLQKFYCLKQMYIYNKIQSYVDEYTPRIAPLIEIDLRNAKLEDAKSSIDEIMNAIRYEKYCEMSLLFSTNEKIQKNCAYNAIDRFIKDKADLYVFDIYIRNKHMPFQEMKQMNVSITNLKYT